MVEGMGLCTIIALHLFEHREGCLLLLGKGSYLRISSGLLPPETIARHAHDEQFAVTPPVFLFKGLQALVVTGGRASVARHVDDEER